MWDIVITELRELVVTVLLALLSVGAAYALAYIRRAKEALDARIDHELADRALERVAYLAEVAVLAAESTTAAALRQAVAEGKASREELVALGRQVVEQVLAQLDVEARKALAETVGDIRQYVESIVEATLERLKAQGVVGRVIFRPLASSALLSEQATKCIALRTCCSRASNRSMRRSKIPGSTLPITD